MCSKLRTSEKDSWWVIVLKIIAYAIGLILGGVATSSCAHLVGLF